MAGFVYHCGATSEYKLSCTLIISMSYKKHFLSQSTSLVSSGDRDAYFLVFICIILIVRQTIALPVCWILVETIAQTPEDDLPRESVLWGSHALDHFISVPCLFCSFTASPNLVHKSQEQMITSLDSESSSTHHLPFLQSVTLRPSSCHFLWNI